MDLRELNKIVQQSHKAIRLGRNAKPKGTPAQAQKYSVNWRWRGNRKRPGE